MNIMAQPFDLYDDDDYDELFDVLGYPQPEDQISPRVAIPDFSSSQRTSQPLTSSPGGAPGQGVPPRNAVRQAINQRVSSRSPSYTRQDLMNDPLADLYNEDQDRLQSLRKAAIGSNAISNIGEGFSQLSRGVAPPQDSKVPLLMNQQNQGLLEGLTSDVGRREKIMNAIEQRKSRESIYGSRANNQAEASKVKQGLTQDKQMRDRADRLNKLLTEELASGRSVLGIAAKNRQRIDDIEGFLQGKKDLSEVDNRELYEIARGLDSVVSQGSPTISGTEHLIPDTLRKRIASKLEFVKNQRQGAHAESFLKNMLGNIENQKMKAQHQIRTAKEKSLASYRDLEQSSPDVWANIMSAHGLNEPEGSTGNNPSKGPALGAIEDGYRFKGGDPTDETSWEKVH